MERLHSDVKNALAGISDTELMDAWASLLATPADPSKVVEAAVLAAVIRHLIEVEMERRDKTANERPVSASPQGETDVRREGREVSVVELSAEDTATVGPLGVDFGVLQITTQYQQFYEVRCMPDGQPSEELLARFVGVKIGEVPETGAWRVRVHGPVGDLRESVFRRVD